MTNGDKIIDILLKENNGKQFSIAFLPYKREMWDSMRSVYESAVSNGMYANLIPIPYWSVKKSEYRYETDYDFEIYPAKFFWVQKYDYVVIHNAYDDKNSITQIDKQFYTDRLKRQGKIVYIPYYVMDESPFTLIELPGVLNSDYIFVNTETDKKKFEAYLEKNYKSGKVFSTGSPKFDAVIDSLEDSKTVLVATSLLSFLANPGTKLEQYRAVIDEQLDKGNIVIYRPHPLLDDMIRSMCSKFAYADYVEFICNIGHRCFIDRTADISNTFKIADILISDPSSIINLWNITGKPLQIMR